MGATVRWWQTDRARAANAEGDSVQRSPTFCWNNLQSSKNLVAFRFAFKTVIESFLHWIFTAKLLHPTHTGDGVDHASTGLCSSEGTFSKVDNHPSNIHSGFGGCQETLLQELEWPLSSSEVIPRGSGPPHAPNFGRKSWRWQKSVKMPWMSGPQSPDLNLIDG